MCRMQENMMLESKLQQYEFLIIDQNEEEHWTIVNKMKTKDNLKNQNEMTRNVGVTKKINQT
jgi:hypothetical protein